MNNNNNVNGYIWSSFVAFSGLLPSQNKFTSDLSSIVQNIYLDNRFSTESYNSLSIQGKINFSSADEDYKLQISELENISYGKILTEFFSILSSYINIRNRWRRSEVYTLYKQQ